MFHLENCNKNSKRLGTYLNRNASDREFQTLRQELDRLEAAVGDKYPSLFTSKDSFLFFALFHKFTLLCGDDSRYAAFLDAFQEELHTRTVPGLDLSFDDVNANRATKDKNVIIRKLHILEHLMMDFLHIEAGAAQSAATPEQFIAACTGLTPGEVEKDIEFYSQLLDDLETVAIKDNSKLLAPENRLSLLAMAAYSCKHKVDLEAWMTSFAQRHDEYLADQRENYRYMVMDLEKNGGSK